MPILYIMCGPSGCGKTTFLKNDWRFRHCIHVSRDTIRFSLLKDDEDYFAHETEVFEQFVKAIADALREHDVVADATHLNPFSRKKLTNALDAYVHNYKIVYIVFNIDEEVCVARNASRTGRANVPEEVVRNMCRTFQAPTTNEDARVVDIIYIKGDEKNE